MKKKSKELIESQEKISEIIYKYHIDKHLYRADKASEIIEVLTEILITMMMYDINITKSETDRSIVIKKIDEYLRNAVMEIVNHKNNFYDHLAKNFKEFYERELNGSTKEQ